MQVAIKLLGALGDFVPPGKLESEETTLTLRDGATLAELIGGLELAAGADFFAMLNDAKIDDRAFAATRVRDGDRVVLCAAIKGG